MKMKNAERNSVAKILMLVNGMLLSGNISDMMRLPMPITMLAA